MIGAGTEYVVLIMPHGIAAGPAIPRRNVCLPWAEMGLRLRLLLNVAHGEPKLRTILELKA